MKRFSPAAVLLAAAASVMLIDAVIFVVPRALAAPDPTIAPNVAIAAVPTLAAPVWPPSADPNATPWWPAPTIWIPGPTPTPAPPTPSPAPKPTPAPYRDTVWNARTYAKNVLGFKGYDCVNAIWTAESKWNPYATNPYSGAYGIPQAYPGWKMSKFGSNWRYSPLTQVKWGIWYVNTTYGSACAAYQFWVANGWY